MIGLWNIANERPASPAVIGPDGRTLSYGELAEQANRYARGLQAMGLKPGDAIVMMLPNGPEVPEVYFAATQIGLYVVAVNWHLVGPEVAYILEDSGAKAFVAHERFAEVATEAAIHSGLDAKARFSVGQIPGFRPLTALGEGQPDEPPEHRTMGTPMLYTSGTTGRPKGVRRPFPGLDPHEVNPAGPAFFSLFGLTPFDDHVHLCGSPLYHTAVLNFVNISLQLGHPVVLMDRWDPEEMLRLIERHRVTH